MVKTSSKVKKETNLSVLLTEKQWREIRPYVLMKPTPHHLTLTPQQKIIALLVAQGRSNKEIAYDMGLTENTIKTHVSIMLKNNNVHNRVQLALLMMRN